MTSANTIFSKKSFIIIYNFFLLESSTKEFFMIMLYACHVALIRLLRRSSKIWKFRIKFIELEKLRLEDQGIKSNERNCKTFVSGTIVNVF